MTRRVTRRVVRDGRLDDMERPSFITPERWAHLRSRVHWKKAATDRELAYLDPIAFAVRTFRRDNAISS